MCTFGRSIVRLHKPLVRWGRGRGRGDFEIKDTVFIGFGDECDETFRRRWSRRERDRRTANSTVSEMML